MSHSSSPYISPTGVWSPELAASGAHKHDAPLADALRALLARPDHLLVDFGCGPGHYLDDIGFAFLHAIGVEGTPGATCSPEGLHPIIRADLTSPGFLPPPSDVSLCLEVGEHIPAIHMHTLLDAITCNTSRTLVLSWATPGQGGDGHVNELPITTVQALLKDRGFIHDRPASALTHRLRAAASLAWMRANVTVYRRTS